MNTKTLRYPILAALAVFLTAPAYAQIDRDSENASAGIESGAKIETWASDELLDIVDRLPGILSAKHTPNHRSREYREEAAELEDLLESAKPDAEIIRIVLEKYPKAKPEQKRETESPGNKPGKIDLKPVELLANKATSEAAGGVEFGADARLRAAAEKAVRALAKDGDAGAKTIVRLFYDGRNKDEDFLKAMKRFLLKNELSVPRSDPPLDSGALKSYLDAVIKTARKLAEDGDVCTQLMLGVFYARASNARQDLSEAVKWLGMAADNGIGQAVMLNAEIYSNGGPGVKPDFAEAVKWYKKAVELGIANAAMTLAGYYADGGPGMEPDFAEAVKWYEKAAGLGDGNAAMILAEQYRLGGHGMEPDLAEAAKWYKKAAGLDEQNGRAMYRLGECYEYGFGVEPDLKAASGWYDNALHHAVRMGWFGLKRCAAKGSADAMCDIAENIANNCAFSYRYLSNFHEEAAKWRRKAGDQGNARALRELAEAYREGLGVDQDEEKAFELFRQAAELGDPEAMGQLGDYYYAGEFVERDIDASFEWYKRAAEKGDVYSQFTLGFRYDHVIQYKNLPEAIKYYRMAAEQGHEGAKKRLEELEK